MKETLKYIKELKSFQMSIIIAILLSSLLILNCEKIDVPDETPNCIKRKIRKILRDQKRNPPAKVLEYTYNGMTVYYIPPYCCDEMSELFDDKCNLICHPDGGFSGNGDGNCSDFFQNRTDEKLVWEDKR